jgi:hypothetical protein
MHCDMLLNTNITQDLIEFASRNLGLLIIPYILKSCMKYEIFVRPFYHKSFYLTEVL